MRKYFLLFALLASTGTSASDNYLDAMAEVCAGWKQASEYSFKAWEMDELRELQRYSEQAQRKRGDWLVLSDDDKCLATHAEKRSGNLQQWFDKS